MLQLGGLIRYLPYPVVSGFLAGTGWLLFIGGLSLTCGEWSFWELFQSKRFTRWFPSLLFSLALFYVVRRYNYSAVLSGTIFFGILVFYGTAPSLISIFPRDIMGGLVMYLGHTFLFEWAYQTYFRLPKIDFAIIWMVLNVIAIFCFIPGVGVGLFAAVIMFVVSYSRTEVVRH